MTRAADDALALAFAHGLPYAGLRDERHDSAIVPDDLARASRVVALRAGVERVRLAAAEPEPDLSGLSDHLAGRTAEIAIAPRDEIDAILGPPPPAPPGPDPAPARADDGATEEPSWLAPAPARTGPPLIALVAVAIVLLAAGAAVAVWLST